MQLLCALLLLVSVLGHAHARVIECGEGCGKIFHSLFVETDIAEAKRHAEGIDAPCKHFYKYFLHNYHDVDTEEMVKSLVISLDATCAVKDLAALVYATKIEGKINILGTVQEAGAHYKKVAEQVHRGFFDKKLALFAKWEFESLEKEGENTRIINFVKTLTSGGDSVAVENLLSLIKIGHVDGAAHMEFLKDCARKGRADAMGMLGNMYYYGWGVGKNKLTARHYFAEGAKRNDPDSLNGLGMILVSENSVKEGKKILEKASGLGSAAADYNLFLLYEKTNSFLAELHLIKSAKQEGYLPAVYKHGEKSWARNEHSTSLLQFKSIAAYHPAVLKIEKLSTEHCKAQKHTEALYTSLLLGDMGSVTGYKNALFILSQKKTDVPKKEMLSILINRRLADQGHASAAISLGDIHYHGRGVPQDWRKAFSRYSAASFLGSTEGHYHLGWMYEHGHGVQKNYAMAHTLYAKMHASNPNTYVLYGIVASRLFVKQYCSAIFSVLTLVGTGLVGAYLLVLVWGQKSVPSVPSAGKETKSD